MYDVVGKDTSGKNIYGFDLEIDGLCARILSYGGILQALKLDDYPHHLVLGYPNAAPYLEDKNYIGATVGRFANRIRNGRFEIEGQAFQLDQNIDGGHHLHGGSDGASKHNWSVLDVSKTHVVLADHLPDGHMGYPGNLEVQLSFRLAPDRCLEVEITAQTDVTTLCNFALHNYFNLGGEKTIDGHRLQVFADGYLETDEDTVPTGRTVDVAGSSFDLRQGRALTRDLHFDHNFCLDQPAGSCQLAACLTSPDEQISLKVSTSEPGLQVYSGDFLAPSLYSGYERVPHSPRAGLALEPQRWPDAPNQPTFPSAILKPGGTYKQVCKFQVTKN